MLGRLRLTQRLGLLLVLPLLAVLLTSVPLTMARVNDARAASAIVDSARTAQVVAAVIQDLQSERLLALAYLASGQVNRSALIGQIQTVRDLAAQARTRLTTAAPALQQALSELITGVDQRQAVLARSTTVTTAQEAYHRAVLGLIDALRLSDQPFADAAGLRQMTALDSMLRAGEIANQVDAALVMGAVDPAAARALVATSGPVEQVYLDRFRQQGDPGQVALLDVIATGPSATRVRAVTAMMTRPDGSSAPVPLDVGLSAAQAGIAIRTGLTDHVVNDITTQAGGRATAATAAAAGVGGSVLALIVLVSWLSTWVSRSVSRPLRRVAAAASAVATLAAQELVRVTDVESDDHRPPRLAAVTLRSADEIGELASAFNRVQATAALMMEQQVTTRRNVAVMFANIARRTGGLVARQLAQIEELEQEESDERRLAKLYRLDHLTTRLRRSADSLLVVAGVRPDDRIDAPMPLADVIRSAIGEVEGYRRIELGTVTNIRVTAAAVGDLTLLLAELLENATSFSPPGSPVEISAEVRGSGRIRIVDRGIGMSPPRLAEENLRLVTRERLDIAPTARLGLLVVGRLTRRHGLTVRLSPTDPTGITAEVVVPAELFLRGVAAQPTDADATHRRPAPDPRPPVPLTRPSPSAPPLVAPTGAQLVAPGQVEPQPVTQDPAPPVAGVISRGRLRRRQPGANLAGIEIPVPSPATHDTTGHLPVHAARDPAAEKAALDAFAQGTVRAAEAVARHRPPQDVHGGLRQRRPGEHLDESVRATPHTRPAGPGSPWSAPTTWPGHPETGTTGPAAPRVRDAESERDVYLGYLAGLARAQEATPTHRDDRRSSP